MPTTDTTTGKSIISKRAAIAVLFAAALVLGACANEKTTQQTAGTTKPAGPTTQAASSTGGAAAPLAVRTTALGDILAGKDGLTLYGFTNDVEAKSTCEGVCAEAWPPVTVSANWTPGPGLDSGIFATAPRSDGTLQLVAGKWPLYYYTGDVAAGDVNGQGSGDVWFVVAPDGKLIKDAKPEGESAAAESDAAPVTKSETDLGTVLVDAEGLTVYGFTKDTAGTPTCSGGCATAWPAVKVEGDELPEGLDPKVFSLVDAVDGGKQLKVGKWPLYRFSGDAAPGETNGQGSGGVWFVVAPDGSLIKGDAPAPSASKDPAPDDSGDDSGY
jgi:predicted lipoprotein with Yx(FWY)xxD motif